jgi:hypothetical protein
MRRGEGIVSKRGCASGEEKKGRGGGGGKGGGGGGLI